MKDQKKLMMNRIVVMKTHESSELLKNQADLLFLPIRDVRDALLFHMQLEQKSIGLLKNI